MKLTTFVVLFVITAFVPTSSLANPKWVWIPDDILNRFYDNRHPPTREHPKSPVIIGGPDDPPEGPPKVVGRITDDPPITYNYHYHQYQRGGTHRLREAFSSPNLDQPSLAQVLVLFRDNNSLTVEMDKGEQCQENDTLTDSGCEKELFSATILDSIERRVAFQFEHVSKFSKMYPSLIPNAVLLSQLQQILESNSVIPTNLKRRIQILTSKLETFQPILMTHVLSEITDQNIIQEFRLISNSTLWGKISQNGPSSKQLSMNDLTEDPVAPGSQKEVLWRTINGDCFSALLSRCEVPFICEKLFLGEPLAQYALSHQVMYRQLGNQLCRGHPDLLQFSQNNAQELEVLCQKSYKEAEFIANNDFHAYMINLFAEHVGGCGLQGYEDFARKDWVSKLMSLEIPGVGCAPNVYAGTIDTTNGEQLRTSDPVLKLEDGKECLIHLGSEIIYALAVSLRHHLNMLSY